MIRTLGPERRPTQGKTLHMDRAALLNAAPRQLTRTTTCPTCGYDRIGLPGPECPECGLLCPFERSRPRIAPPPFLSRGIRPWWVLNVASILLAGTLVFPEFELTGVSQRAASAIYLSIAETCAGCLFAGGVALAYEQDHHRQTLYNLPLVSLALLGIISLFFWSAGPLAGV